MIQFIIPARGGSKGIKNKNLMMLDGVSLLGRAIRTCLKARRVPWVSTDSDRIAREALRHGAKVIERPAELATDIATTDSVLVHAAKTIGATTQADAIGCVVCTTPFLKPADIVAACTLWAQRWCGCIMGCKRFARFVWGFNHENDLRPINMAWGDRPMRQDWPIQYLENSMVHIVGAQDLIKRGTRTIHPVIPLEFPEERSLDIDTPEDLAYARWLVERKKRRKPIDYGDFGIGG